MHLSLLALKHNAAHVQPEWPNAQGPHSVQVHLIVRGPLRQRQFDLQPEWLSQRKNLLLNQYYLGAPGAPTVC